MNRSSSFSSLLILTFYHRPVEIATVLWLHIHFLSQLIDLFSIAQPDKEGLWAF